MVLFRKARYLFYHNAAWRITPLEASNRKIKRYYISAFIFK